MNWIRDNILKILIILGVTIAVIVVFCIIASPKNDGTVSGTKYAELETKLQNAAIKYVDSHKKLLPTTTENVTKIKLSTLQSNNYIGKLVAVENSKTKCDGYVEITKLKEDEEDYRYTPYISCGEYYTTRTIGDYIIDTETKNGEFNRTTDAGLYKGGDEYIFRGENVNNYLMLDNHLYRIIKIDANKSLQLISAQKTDNGYVWDDRYNVEKNSLDGINTFTKSRLYEGLVRLYELEGTSREPSFFSETEKTYIIPHEFCIGKRSISDINIYSGVECKETTTLYVGLITLSEYSRASIDSNCKGIYDRSCSNYNYFNALGKETNYTHFTLTGVLDNTYQFYRVRSGEVSLTKTSNSAQIYPVIYINNKTIYTSGTGTMLDPYVVR